MRRFVIAVVAIACACSGRADPDAGIPLDCPAGEHRCDGVCRDLRLDDNHCGSCGKSCAQGTTCAAGNCFADDCPEVDCSAAQVCISQACRERLCAGVLCPDGQACYLGVCESRMCSGIVCSTGLACISGACTDTSCLGVLCAQGKGCEQGACVAHCDAGPCPAACDGGTCMRAPAKSCAAVLAADPASSDGLYAIDPDGPGGTTSFLVYCLMSVEGGGWTHVATLSGSAVLTDLAVGTFAADPFKLASATINRIFSDAGDRRVLIDFGTGALMELKFAMPWGVTAFQSPVWRYLPQTAWFGPCALPASGLGPPSLIWIRAACAGADAGGPTCACAPSGHEAGLFGSGFLSTDNGMVFPRTGWSPEFKVYVR